MLYASLLIGVLPGESLRRLPLRSVQTEKNCETMLWEPQKRMLNPRNSGRARYSQLCKSQWSIFAPGLPVVESH